MNVVKNADFDFKFSDGSAATFTVEALPKSDRQMLLGLSKAKRQNFEKRNEDILDRWDFDKFYSLLVRRVVKGWTGLLNKHLLVILDCDDEVADKWQFKGDGRAEFEIEYSEDQKREIADLHSPMFRTFIDTCLETLAEQNVAAKEKQLKN